MIAIGIETNSTKRSGRSLLVTTTLQRGNDTPAVVSTVLDVYRKELTHTRAVLSAPQSLGCDASSLNDCTAGFRRSTVFARGRLSLLESHRKT